MYTMFIQNVKSKPPDVKQFKMSNFSMGLNNMKSSYELNMKESPNILNMICFDEGSIETRPGTVKYLKEIFGEVIKKVFVYETVSFSLFILASDTKLYKIATTGGTITELCTTNRLAECVQVEDKLFIVDGAKYRMYDGTDVFEIIDPTTKTGITVSATNNTIVLDANASAVDDAYNGYQINVATNTGSEVRTISDYVGATKTATVSVNWITNPVVTNPYYITNGTQGSVTTVGTPTFTKMYTPSYQEYIDSYLGANNTTIIKTAQRILHHKARIVFSNNSANKNEVTYTENLNPYYVPTSQWVAAVTDDADTISGVVSFNDVLVIFKTKSIFAMYGNVATDFEMKEVTVSCGTVDIETVAKADNYLLYLGTNGRVYSLYDVRTDVKKLMTKDISGDRIQINKYPISLIESKWTTAHATYYDKYYFLSIDDTILVYDGTGWFMWDTMLPLSFLQYNNKLLYLHSSKYLCRLPLVPFEITESYVATAAQTNFVTLQGYIGEMADAVVKVNNVTVNAPEKISNNEFKVPACTVGHVVTITHTAMLSYNDLGTKYDVHWYSKDIDFDYPSKEKQIRKFYITANTYKEYLSQVNVDLDVDYYTLQTNFVMKNQISLFGLATFGEKFIIKNITDSQPIRVDKRGKIYRLHLYNTTIDQPFKIYMVYGEIIVRMRR